MPGAFTVLAGELDLQGELILQLRVAEPERPLEKGSPLPWGAEATQDGLRARLPAPQPHPQAVSPSLSSGTTTVAGRTGLSPRPPSLL